jgi:hypothetical protein
MLRGCFSHPYVTKAILKHSLGVGLAGDMKQSHGDILHIQLTV